MFFILQVFQFCKKKKSEKMDGKKKVHISSFSITRICQMSVEFLIVVLFIWITQCTPCYVIESELVYY